MECWMKEQKAFRSELDEARSLREEAQSILAEYERKQKEVQNQADQIVATCERRSKSGRISC